MLISAFRVPTSGRYVKRLVVDLEYIYFDISSLFPGFNKSDQVCFYMICFGRFVFWSSRPCWCHLVQSTHENYDTEQSSLSQQRGEWNGVSRISLPPCRHEFHKHCIHGWIARKRLDCPNCRETTTMDVSNIPVIPDSSEDYIKWEFGIFDAVLECFRCLGASVPGTYRSIDD